MGFWTLFMVASMPIVQVLIVSLVGAVMATDSINLLSSDTRRALNKIVFVAFTPSLIFSSLAKTVTLEDIISWWFMPINIGITFLFGGTLGWLAVKLLKPKPHLEGLVVAMCSTGNLGNLLLIIVPAICTQGGSPFGDHNVCKTKGLSYSSFSMALGSFFVWTYTFQLIRTSALKYRAMMEAEELSKEPNNVLDSNEKTSLLNANAEERVDVVVAVPDSTSGVTGNRLVVSSSANGSSSSKLMEILHKILEELLAPPTLGSIAGFVFGATPFLNKLMVGDDAPLRVIQDSIDLIGEGTIPCITLILGGNLIQGLRHASIGLNVVLAIICVRYVILPMIGIVVIKIALNMGLLPIDPLFSFVLLIQFTLPPAMNISTMTQLYNVGQEECSVLTMWTYLAAAFALTAWSTVFMWILT